MSAPSFAVYYLLENSPFYRKVSGVQRRFAGSTLCVSTLKDIATTVVLSGPALVHTAAAFVQSGEQGEALGSTTQRPLDEAARERKLIFVGKGGREAVPPLLTE